MNPFFWRVACVSSLPQKKNQILFASASATAKGDNAIKRDGTEKQSETRR